jgi:hypothetical protein
VPLYDSLGEHAVEYIIKHSEATIAFSQSEKLGTLAKSLSNVRANQAPCCCCCSPLCPTVQCSILPPLKRFNPPSPQLLHVLLCFTPTPTWHWACLQVDGLIKTVVYWGKPNAAAQQVGAWQAGPTCVPAT